MAISYFLFCSKNWLDILPQACAYFLTQLKLNNIWLYHCIQEYGNSKSIQATNNLKNINTRRPIYPSYGYATVMKGFQYLWWVYSIISVWKLRVDVDFVRLCRCYRSVHVHVDAGRVDCVIHVDVNLPKF